MYMSVTSFTDGWVISNRLENIRFTESMLKTGLFALSQSNPSISLTKLSGLGIICFMMSMFSGFSHAGIRCRLCLQLMAMLALIQSLQTYLISKNFTLAVCPFSTSLSKISLTILCSPAPLVVIPIHTMSRFINTGTMVSNNSADIAAISSKQIHPPSPVPLRV